MRKDQSNPNLPRREEFKGCPPQTGTNSMGPQLLALHSEYRDQAVGVPNQIRNVRTFRDRLHCDIPEGRELAQLLQTHTYRQLQPRVVSNNIMQVALADRGILSPCNDQGLSNQAKAKPTCGLFSSSWSHASCWFDANSCARPLKVYVLRAVLTPVLLVIASLSLTLHVALHSLLLLF